MKVLAIALGSVGLVSLIIVLYLLVEWREFHWRSAAMGAVVAAVVVLGRSR
jgi:hypothetical protein